MKKTFLFSIASLLLFGGANATICKLVPTKCYTTMGTGYLYDTYDSASWDITSNCWGKKKICAEALSNNTGDNEPKPMGRKEIADTSRINSDFDVMILNGDCFGARKVKDGGAMISVDNKYVNVWCPGVLDAINVNITETFDNGDITSVPVKCENLGPAGYIDIRDGKCYGKYYDQSEYAIQCNNDNPTLIILNGVDIDNIVDTDIKTRSDADARFRTMYENAKRKHKDYFKD